MKDEDWKEFIKKEMDKSIDDIMAEIEADPKMKDVKPPEGMYEELMEKIHEHERQTIYEQLSDEDKELIQLGRVYKKKRSFDKFVVALAAVIVGLGLGSVCIGEDKNILNFATKIFDSREQTNVDSGDTDPNVYNTEAEIYEQIESEYFFSPVKLEYLPEKAVFYEGAFCMGIQGVNIIYEVDNQSSIVYIIRPNYREASLGTDVEDEKTQEYTLMVNNVEATIAKYHISETGGTRWTVTFIYEDVLYMLRITNIKQEEVEKIVQGLRFVN